MLCFARSCFELWGMATEVLFLLNKSSHKLLSNTLFVINRFRLHLLQNRSFVYQHELIFNNMYYICKFRKASVPHKLKFYFARKLLLIHQYIFIEVHICPWILPIIGDLCNMIHYKHIQFRSININNLTQYHWPIVKRKPVIIKLHHHNQQSNNTIS